MVKLKNIKSLALGVFLAGPWTALGSGRALALSLGGLVGGGYPQPEPLPEVKFPKRPGAAQLVDDIAKTIEGSVEKELLWIFDQDRKVGLTPPTNILRVKGKPVWKTISDKGSQGGSGSTKVKAPHYRLSVNKAALYDQYLRVHDPLGRELDILAHYKPYWLTTVAVTPWVYPWFVVGGAILINSGSLALGLSLIIGPLALAFGIIPLIFVIRAAAIAGEENSQAKEIINAQPDELVYIDKSQKKIEE